jgi:hypothetical protein
MAKTTTKRKTTITPRGVNANDLSIVLANLGLKYDPQVSQINTLNRQAQGQYASDIEGAKAQAASTVNYAKAARPTTQAIYDQANAQTDAEQADVAAAFQKAGGAADVFSAATAREHAQQKARLAGASAAAQTGLTNRITGALAGRQAGYMQAQADLGKTKDTLATQLSDVLKARGNDLTAMLGSLRNQRVDRLTKTRTEETKVKDTGPFAGMTVGEVAKLSPTDRAAIVDKFNADKVKPKAGAKADRRTANERQSLSDVFNEARDTAVKAATGNLGDGVKYNRAQAANMLLHGTVPTTEAAAKGKQGIKKAGQLAATLALDMAYDGRISKQNARRLHKLGYKVDDLVGARSYTAAEATPQKRLSSKYGWGQ